VVTNDRVVRMRKDQGLNYFPGKGRALPRTTLRWNQSGGFRFHSGFR
jgi:hypothetical protein